jgi:hypothetical protein
VNGASAVLAVLPSCSDFKFENTALTPVDGGAAERGGAGICSCMGVQGEKTCNVMIGGMLMRAKQY